MLRAVQAGSRPVAPMSWSRRERRQVRRPAGRTGRRRRRRRRAVARRRRRSPGGRDGRGVGGVRLAGGDREVPGVHGDLVERDEGGLVGGHLDRAGHRDAVVRRRVLPRLAELAEGGRDPVAEAVLEPRSVGGRGMCGAGRPCGRRARTPRRARRCGRGGRPRSTPGRASGRSAGRRGRPARGRRGRWWSVGGQRVPCESDSLGDADSSAASVGLAVDEDAGSLACADSLADSLAGSLADSLVESVDSGVEGDAGSDGESVGRRCGRRRTTESTTAGRSAASAGGRAAGPSRRCPRPAAARRTATGRTRARRAARWRARRRSWRRRPAPASRPCCPGSVARGSSSRAGSGRRSRCAAGR